MTKYIVWIKERGTCWEEDNAGAMGYSTAERLAAEIRLEGGGVATKVLPEGRDPDAFTYHEASAFSADDCGGVFDGIVTVQSDADSGL